MRALGTICAIFAASAGLDAEQTTALHLFAMPMLKVDGAALRNQIEERLMKERRKLIKLHRVVAMLDRKSKIENRKLIDPLAVFGSEDRQFLHHELRLANSADHMRAGGSVPFLRHLLAGVTAPTLDVCAVNKIGPLDFG